MRLYITIFLTTILFTNLHAQKTKSNQFFEIRGRVEGINNGDTILLYSYDRDNNISSSIVKDGIFIFKGATVNQPELFNLKYANTGKDFGNSFLIGNDFLKITGNIKYPNMFIMTGSDYQKGWEKITSIHNRFSIKEDSLNNDGYEKNKSEIAMLRKQEDQVMIEHIKANIDSDFAALIYLNNYKKYVTKDTLTNLYSKIPKSYLTSKYAIGVLSYLHQSLVGDKVASFKAIDQSGNNIEFTDLYSQKPTLLMFTAAWCQPCVMSIPEIKKLHQQYGDVLNIVSFSIDANKKVWLKKIKEENIKWINLWDGKAAHSPAFIQYGFTGIPSYLLVDTKGVILDKGTTGYTEGQYFEIIEKMLALKKSK